MLAIRSTTRFTAIAAAAAAGACMMLGGCGGGSTGSTGGAAATGGASSSAAAPTGGSSTGSGGGGAAAGFSAPKLTGHFCTDFTNIGRNLPKIPAADRNNLAALQAHGGQFIKDVAAYFTALANEAPPQASAELKIIASAYTSLAGGALSASSVTQFEQQMQGLTTHGKTGQAFISLITYITTHCG